MEKNRIIIMTLLISAFLVSSVFSGIAMDTKTTNMVGILDIDKQVKIDGGEWTDFVTIDLGDEVLFRINVTYYNETPGVHYVYNLNITDTLPVINDGLCLEYVEMITGDDPVIIGDNSEKLYWLYDDPSFKLEDEETITLIFKAISVMDCDCCQDPYIINRASTMANEMCTGQILKDTDTAKVKVDCADPDIFVDKKLWDYKDEKWVSTGYGIPYSDVRFNITVENSGDCILDTVWVNETLPKGLEYNNDASPAPYNVDDRNITWKFTDVVEDGKIYIEFDATLMDNIPNNQYVNLVEATGINTDCCCPNEVTDTDTAIVKVRGMIVEKEVSVKTETGWGPWVEEAEAANGQTVKFRIMIYYYGYYTLYDILVEDTLPEGLEYDNNAIPEEPDIDGNVLSWFLEEALYDGEHTTICFQAVVDCDDCENLVNLVSVVAKECSGSTLEWDDEATVDVVCALTADAGGPYSGLIDEDIEIVGSANGGSPPYIYEWDLDNDGEYDDEAGNEIISSWDEPGTYEISLKVTDDEGRYDTDDTAVIINPGENHAPEKPETPQGPTSGNTGNSYTYTTSTTDPDGDQVYYKFDWGDGTSSGWLGPYDSGEEAQANHIWANRGSYPVKVKARDVHDEESVWSDPLSVAMPKSKEFRNPLINIILQLLKDKFPMIAKILMI